MRTILGGTYIILALLALGIFLDHRRETIISGEISQTTYDDLFADTATTISMGDGEHRHVSIGTVILSRKSSPGWRVLDDSCVYGGAYPGLEEALPQGACPDAYLQLTHPGGPYAWQIYVGP